jgi:hypothetical protein
VLAPIDHDRTYLTEAQQLQREGDYWRNRVLLREALEDAFQSGHLRTEGTDDEAMGRWAKRTYELVVAALGKEQAREFLGDKETFTVPKAPSNRFPELSNWDAIMADGRTDKLGSLARHVDSLLPLTLQPDFEGAEWVSKR